MAENTQGAPNGKRSKKRRLLWIIPGLILLLVLCSYLPRLRRGATFTYTEQGMTDGEHQYIWLPDGWHERYTWLADGARGSGRYRYFLGWSEDGRPVYAMDEEGTLIRKRKKWYQDMEWRSLYRADHPLPDIFGDDCTVSVGLATKLEEQHYTPFEYYLWQYDTVDLSPEAARAFQNVLQQLYDLKAADKTRRGYPKTYKNILVSWETIESPAFPSLQFEPDVDIFWIDGKAYAWYESEYCVVIDEDSPLYETLKQYHDMYR